MCTYRYNYNSGNQLKIYNDYERLDLYDRFMTKLEPITKEQFDKCLSQSGRYIFRDRDNKAYCSACDSRFEFVGGKHKEAVHCPKCGKELRIHNTWRTKNLPVWHDWYAFVDKTEEENTICIRYILTQHHGDGSVTCEEDARVIWNIAIDDEIHYEWTYDPDYCKWNWRIQNTEYFNYYRGMTPNNYICTGAEWDEDNYLDLIQSLPCFECIDLKALGYEGFAEIAKNISVVEKLQKINLNELAAKWLGTYCKGDYLDMSQTSLMKMLKIDRNDFHYLLENQDLKVLTFLQNHHNVSEKEFTNFKYFGEYGLDKITEKCNYYHIKRGKVINYLKKKVYPFGFEYMDYIDYLNMIDRLNYPIDNRYAYPKDFVKFKSLIIERFNEMKERERNMNTKELALDEAKKDQKIYMISKALSESKELKKWFTGSDGLKVFVPESVGELLDAGVQLHNCLGNYANKILSNESLVFFIRKIEEPNKEYIAMEYADGKVNQLRLDDHKRVVDKKIINFADALARKLNEMNVRETIVENIIREVA